MTEATRTVDGWELPVGGTNLAVRAFDHELVVAFGEVAELRIEGQFSLGARQSATDGPKDPTLVERLHGATARAALARHDGALVIDLGGLRLAVAADPSFEAWSFTMQGGFRLVSLPGGGLAEWS